MQDYPASRPAGRPPSHSAWLSREKQGRLSPRHMAASPSLSHDTVPEVRDYVRIRKFPSVLGQGRMPEWKFQQFRDSCTHACAYATR